uniref:Uncharacterized protein n=1 Tax=Mesocestoides corti TaxID=53468 RepID=A0A5K3EZ35_MESCO
MERAKRQGLVSAEALAQLDRYFLPEEESEKTVSEVVLRMEKDADDEEEEEEDED